MILLFVITCILWNKFGRYPCSSCLDLARASSHAQPHPCRPSPHQFLPSFYLRRRLQAAMMSASPRKSRVVARTAAWLLAFGVVSRAQQDGSAPFVPTADCYASEMVGYDFKVFCEGVRTAQSRYS